MENGQVIERKVVAPYIPRGDELHVQVEPGGDGELEAVGLDAHALLTQDWV